MLSQLNTAATFDSEQHPCRPAWGEVPLLEAATAPARPAGLPPPNPEERRREAAARAALPRSPAAGEGARAAAGRWGRPHLRARRERGEGPHGEWGVTQGVRGRIPRVEPLRTSALCVLQSVRFNKTCYTAQSSCL